MSPIAKESRSHPLNVVTVGPWDDCEFIAARQGIDPWSDWHALPNLAAACDQIETAGSPPELILLAQPRPGAVNPQDVDRLHSLAPLTRLIVVAGSWCEGELRSGQPLQGVVRLYWHELAAWWRAALSQLSHGVHPPWSAPLDDLRAGQLMCGDAQAGVRIQNTESRDCVAIDAMDYHSFDALSAALASAGWIATWQPRHRPEVSPSEESAGPIAAGIFDGGQLSDDEFSALARFCDRCAQASAPVLVLLDYPRVEHVEKIRTAGAAALLGKPYQLSMLFDELRRIRALVSWRREPSLTTLPPAPSE